MLVRVHSNFIFIVVGDVHKCELGQFVGFFGIRAYESFWFDFSQKHPTPLGDGRNLDCQLLSYRHGFGNSEPSSPAVISISVSSKLNARGLCQPVFEAK